MEHTSIATVIKGVFVQPLQIQPTPAGPVLHMLRADYALMPAFPDGFGEIYFSEILPGRIKAWKKHKLQTQLFAVPAGLIRLVIYDDRPQSPSSGEILEIISGRPDNYALVRIPPLVWYGFSCLSATPALICNCADLPHSPDEGLRQAANSRAIPYAWPDGSP